MKVLSTRDRDLEDARTIIASLGDRLDRALMVQESGLLAREILDHDVGGRFRAVIDWSTDVGDRTSSPRNVSPP